MSEQPRRGGRKQAKPYRRPKKDPVRILAFEALRAVDERDAYANLVLPPLLRKTGILCVYGSGFGLPPEDGFFRVVFLAHPDTLSAIYDDIATFTSEWLRQ